MIPKLDIGKMATAILNDKFQTAVIKSAFMAQMFTYVTLTGNV
jgi:hypothetical protein